MIDDHRIATLAVSILFGALSLAVFAWRPGSPLLRSFSLLIGLRAIAYGLLAVEDNIFSLSGRIVPYIAMALPFAALDFVLVYRKHHGASFRRWHRFHWLLWLPLAALYATDHQRFWDDDSGWLSLTLVGLYASYALGAIGLYAAARRAEPIVRSAAGALVVGFAVEPFYFPTFHVINVAKNGPFGAVYNVEAILYGALVVALLGLVVTLLRQRSWRREGIALAGLGGLAAASAIWAVLDFDVVRLFLFDAIWHTVLVGTSTVALLRYRALGFEWRARQAATGGVILGLGGIWTFIGFAIGASTQVGSAVGAGVAIVSFALVSMFLIGRIDGFVDDWLRDVDGSDDYWRRHRAELYLTALVEQRASRGPLRQLRRYGEGIGLAPAEMEIIEGSIGYSSSSPTGTGRHFMP